MLRCNWNDMELEARYGGKGFWHDRQLIFSKPYSDYMVEVYVVRDFHDSGITSKHWTIHLSRYDEYGRVMETYCLDVIQTITKMWQFVAGLELDSTVSAIQTTENQWLTMLQEALSHNCRDYFDKETNCYYFFEVDSEEYVVEVWASYRLPNGALTTMSYVSNIWADEMPIVMRGILW